MREEVRCACGRLLAMVREDGVIEIQAGRRVIVTERALLTCEKCGRDLEVDQNYLRKKFFHNSRLTKRGAK